MADDIKAKREKRRLDKEQARQRREHKAKKLVERMLDNEVRDIENWNRDRLNMAKKIDDAYKKGKIDSFSLHVIIPSLLLWYSDHCHIKYCHYIPYLSKFMVEGVSLHML